jgi:hypothetical protein
MGMRGTGTGGGGEGFGRVGGLGKVDTGGGKGVSAKIGGKGKAKVQAKVSRGAANVGQFCAKSNIQAVVGRGSSGDQVLLRERAPAEPVAEWQGGGELDGRSPGLGAQGVRGRARRSTTRTSRAA